MNRNILRGLALVGFLAIGSAARAATTVDTAPMTDAGTAVAAVGAAGFALFLGTKLWKWIRRAV